MPMRSSLPLVILLALAGAATTASAQSCSPPERVAFEFQVQQPAAYVPSDSILRPRPSTQRFVNVREHPEAVVVQFVVDTLGQPETRTFKAINASSDPVVDSVRAVLPRWHFTPAVQGGCKVRQLVQTAVDR